MPRYDYRCEAGHKYEVTEPFGSPSVHPCERCGKEARRQLVAPPLVFKGQGFYKTSGRSSDFGSTGFESNGSSSDKNNVGTTSNRSKTPPSKSDAASSD